MIVNDLEQLSWLRNPPWLYLGPDWHVVQTDLEGPGADELGLHRVAEEEGHHAGVYLVLQHPGSPGRGLHEVNKGVDAS